MKEINKATISGWVILPFVIIAWLCVPSAFITAGVIGNIRSFDALKTLPLAQNTLVGVFVVAGFVMILVSFFLTMGLFSVQPNEGRVLVLFGKYVGTERGEGFHWVNPFSKPVGSTVTQKDPETGNVKVGWKNKYKVSLRARNFETQKIKVNDLRGSPIEIGGVVVWRVADTAQALFEVDDYENYVTVQSESAMRHLANSYPYDHSEGAEDELTLRDAGDRLSNELKRQLQERLSRAGVVVDEARITHLAYAPEIAALMLRRQQAEAVIAARQKIVHGAVSMVEMALKELSEKGVVELDEERKAAMVGNLLVVLCGEAEVQPIVNAGTLYH